MNTQLLKTILRASALTACLCAFSLSQVETLTAADYVAMELEARQITLDGVRDRLALLQANAGLDTQLAGDSDTQQQVDDVFQQYGMTLSSALAWATQHRQAIDDYLAQHPAQQAEYDRIARELETVSTQIQALVNQ
ncbi:hypothetical protein AB835_04035 [Candidatus Endobugula sertula]|uniref:DUF4142 domain-containing protein n=1 Tax=Candidatus Endobugula sertula TaxID=62101 RepID=A0A1D2QRZ2_9GAMM|nr:hypothetical protein AB835_04035 [Candidatus Endobugula sertula]